MDYKLELITIPVGDMDRAKAFRERTGAVKGLHLVVPDIAAARADLASREVDISEPFHLGPEGQTSGPDPDRRSYGSFASFSDPGGNGWMVQEVKP